MANAIKPEEVVKIVHDTRNTAQAAQATIETAQEMLEHANTNPTNKELKESFDKHAAVFEAHTVADKEFQDTQAEVNAATLNSLNAIHERLGNVATTSDIKDIQNFLENWRIGIGIFKFGWNNIGQIALFIVAVYVIIKVGIIGAITYFFGKLP